MKTKLMIAAALLAMTHAGEAPRSALEFTKDGQLVFPSDYREWVYLSSGLGMTYGPAKDHVPDDAPAFDNVFVNNESYRRFVETGTWPEKTIFMLEVRSSASKGSINNGGHYQTGVLAVEAEVKDSTRFPGKWAFFGFGKAMNPAKQIPTTAVCYSCHAANGAVDNTFVQFYPTLLEVARKKGTLNASFASH